MSATQQARKLRENVDAGATSLGELVWWSLANVEISQDDVEKIVGDLEIRDNDGRPIPIKKICPQLQARGALRKALDGIGIYSGGARRKTRAAADDRVILARRIDHRDDPAIPVGDFSVILVEERVRDSVAQGKSVLDHHEVQRVSYSVERKAIEFTTDLHRAEISQGFIKYGKTYKSPEVARVIGVLIELGHGFLARESGGVYFVPKKHERVAAAVEKICAKISGAQFMRWPVLAGSDSSPQVVQTRQLAGAAIRRELEALQVDLETLKDQSEDTERNNPQGRTIQARLDKYKVLRNKAMTYRDLLGLEDQKVKDQINAMTRAAKALLEG